MRRLLTALVAVILILPARAALADTTGLVRGTVTVAGKPGRRRSRHAHGRKNNLAGNDRLQGRLRLPARGIRTLHRYRSP